MSQSFISRERLILTDPTRAPLSAKTSAWDRLVALFGDADLVAVVLFCALGALLTVVLMRSLPGWVEGFAAAAQLQ